MGPSTHLNPSATRSSMAPLGMILSMAGSRRSNLTGAESSMPAGAPDASLPATPCVTLITEMLKIAIAKKENSRERVATFIEFLLVQVLLCDFASFFHG